MKRLAAIFILLQALCACSKNGLIYGGSGQSVLSDHTSPVITILTPTDNQIFAAGKTIQVSASATDNVKVTELHIHVLNKISGALLRDIHNYPDAPTGTAEDSFTAQAGLTYLIQVIANDPSQNAIKSEITVFVN